MAEGLGASGSVPTSGRDFARPRVSVLVATQGGEQRLRRFLDSLAAQTLPADEFEILVIHPGSSAVTAGVLGDFRAEHPSYGTRLLELGTTGTGQARNIALSSARGEYVTFLDDGDRVAPPFLERLLRGAAPDVVSVATSGDAPSEADLGMDPNSAKLVPTALARSVRYRPSLGSGADRVYWLELLAMRRLRVRRADEGSGQLWSANNGGMGSQAMSYDVDVAERLQCLGAIESVDRSDPTVARLAHGLMLEQASRLNGYLREHPDDHAQVVEDARSLGLREVPWRSVNAGLAHDLAICYCFPPDLDTSGMVAARRLRERGLVVDVISKDLSTLRTVDPEALGVVAEVLDRTHVVGGGASFVRWSAVSDFTAEAWSTVEAWEAAQGPYRSVYSRAMAPTSHFAAALVKLRRPDVEWVAEFSDPLRINPVGEERIGEVADDWLSHELRAGLAQAGFEQPEGLEVFDLAERIAYALADQIIFTNRHQLGYMLGYCADRGLADRMRERAEVRRHPTLPADFYDMASTDLVLEPTQVHIAYFGVFYSTRGLGEILRAFARLNHVERERVRLHVFTPNPDRLTLEVIRAGLAGVVKARPFVGFLEFLHLTTRFDVLLVNDAATTAHADVNPYLPSKVSDYLGSGTPIWAVYEEGSVLSAMSFEYRSPLGDVDAALGVLRQLRAHERHRSSSG